VSGALPSLVDGAWLEPRLPDDDLVVIDATVRLSPVAPDGSWTATSGRADWERAHLPGSRHADLLTEFSDPTAPQRFTLPEPDALAAAFGRLGIGTGRRVVLYDDDRSIWAARLWWMLRLLGFDDAALLDGGLRRWTAERRPVTAAQDDPRPATFVPAPRPGLVVGRADVETALADGRAVLVNTLSPAAFRGETTRYGRPGRIPTSVNVPAGALLDPERGTFRPPVELEQLLDEAGVTTERPLIAYCGGGISAAAVAFALTALPGLGRYDVALYDGSLAEWSSDPGLPLETGTPAA
jgi:thiosulfate/3-mercaptopyruvate sulfurtransferase